MINCRCCEFLGNSIKTVDKGQALVPWHYPIVFDVEGSIRADESAPCTGSQAPGRTFAPLRRGS